MRKVFTISKAMLVILFAAFAITSCSKSSSITEPDNLNLFTSPIFSPDSVNVGTLLITKEADGLAKMQISVNKSLLSNASGPYECILRADELPMAELQPLNAEGMSVTYPIRSTNKGLAVSYDALRRMHHLMLQIADNQNKLIVNTEIQ